MAGRRFIPAATVARWEDELHAACTAALDEQLVHVRGALARHGITTPDAMVAAGSKKKAASIAAAIGLGVVAWNAATWATAVARNVAPVAKRVAAEAHQAAKAAVDVDGTWGMPDPSPSYAADLVSTATASGAYVGQRLNANIAGAADPGQAAEDTLATADAIVGGVTGMQAEGLSNAASYDVASYFSSAIGQTGATHTWNAVGDDRTRPDHRDADGQEVPLEDPFTVGGEQLDYPGDPAGSDEQTMNCVPGWLSIDPVAALAVTRRWVDAELVTVTTRSGDVLTATPNHPALTDRGWVPLGSLCIGDHLIHAPIGDRPGVRQPQVENVPAEAQEVFRAMAKAGTGERIVGRPVDFHGDGADGEIEIVGVNCDLSLVDDLPGAEQLRQAILLGAGDGHRVGESGRSGSHPPGDSDRIVGGSPAGIMGGSRQPRPLLGTGASHADGHGIATAPRLDARLDEDPADGAAVDAVRACQSEFADAAEVSAHQVVGVRRYPWSGHVYNLQSAVGWFQSSGYLLHNCRCWLTIDGIDPGIAVFGEPEDQDTATGLENTVNRIGRQTDLPLLPRSHQN